MEKGYEGRDGCSKEKPDMRICCKTTRCEENLLQMGLQGKEETKWFN